MIKRLKKFFSKKVEKKKEEVVEYAPIIFPGTETSLTSFSSYMEDVITKNKEEDEEAVKVIGSFDPVTQRILKEIDPHIDRVGFFQSSNNIPLARMGKDIDVIIKQILFNNKLQDVVNNDQRTNKKQ